MFINHLDRAAPAQILLDGEWRIAFDPENRGKADGWHLLPEPPAGARPISVPSCWEEIEPGYDGVAWYWTTISAAGAARSRLLFDAVNYFAEVWIDGEYVGSSEGGYTPFSFDVTDHLTGEHALVVRVLCPPKDETGTDGFVLKELPCWRSYESFNFGGIWQSVRLLHLPETHLRDVFVRPNATLDGVDVEVELAEGMRGEVSVWIDGEGDPQPSLCLHIKDPKRWTPDDPHLYTLRVRVEAGGEVDEGSVRFGLRSLTFEDNEILLNGEPCFVKGAFHEGLYPIGLPRPTSREFVEDEIRKAKDTGFNLLRYWQIPIHPHVLDAADKLGMMLMNEPPIEWMTQTDQTARRCRDEVERLVRRDRNRASVTFWTILNETGIQPDANRRNACTASQLEYEEAPIQHIRHELCALARSLDPTRLIIDDSGGFMGHANIYLPGESKPVPFNDLHTYERVPIPEFRLNELREMATKEGQTNAATVIPGGAVLMSEFGYGSFPDFASILKRYEDEGATQTEDYAHHKSLHDSLATGFAAHGMGRWLGSVADLTNECQEIHAEGNALQTMALRAGPLVRGYVMHAFSAGGCIIGAELFDT
ncbi:MAG TPA: glycoside hydrolase family 2 TIM barrel-domain containing protein, partial [Armatimonadota bacterium]|nr:glycoside hydrolase family 2 TIM barrel-domain containing protein [Armatimonadota bacterium]